MEKLIEQFSSGYDTVVLYECGSDQKIILKKVQSLHGEFFEQEDVVRYEGHVIEDIYDEMHCKRLHQEIERVLSEWKSMRYMRKHRWNNQEGYWTTTIYPVYEDGTNYVFYCGKRAEDFFEESQRQQRMQMLEEVLMDGSEDAILVLEKTPTGRVRVEEANKKFRVMGKITGNQYLYAEAQEVIPENIYDICRKLWEKAIEERRVTELEEEVRSEDSSRIYYFRVAPVWRAQEQIIVLFVRDVTKNRREQRIRDEMLEEYESYYRSTVIGMCLLWLGDDGSQQVMRSNEHYDAFARKFLLYGTEKFDPEALRRCAINKNVLQKQVTFIMENDSYAFYDLCIVPVGRMGEGYKFFITCANSTEKVQVEQRAAVNLTLREQEMMEYAAKGNSNKSIAAELGVSEGTVKKTLSNAYKKLNISSRSELIKYILSDKHADMR